MPRYGFFCVECTKYTNLSSNILMKAMNDQDKKQMRLRDLPSITAVLKAEPAVLAVSRYGRVATTEAIRDVIDQIRRCIGEDAVAPDAEQLAWKALARLDARDRSGLRPLFNLTGIVLHTNFGRAQLADAAVEAATAAMRHAVAVEFSLETGKRGTRRSR